MSMDEAMGLADLIMQGNLPEAVVGGLLVALRMKGETPEEIAGFAASMRQHSLKVRLGDALDTAGTGGDGLGTLNVSTAVAILVSQVYPVAKHGNRAASSKSGSADFLEALGYNIEVPPQRAEVLFKNHGFVFLFAQQYHPSMRNVASTRKALGIRTIFNILGPLTNPAGVKRQLLGVFSRDFMLRIAMASTLLGYEKLVLVHGEPGLDEISPSGRTFVVEVRGSRLEEYVIDSQDLLRRPIDIVRLQVNSAEESAIRVLRASVGKDKEAEEFIKLNSSMVLYTAGKVKDLKDGYELSAQLLEGVPKKIQEIVADNGDPLKYKSLVARALGQS
jgi:anthranilate phosphoribosyltransferase